MAPVVLLQYVVVSSKKILFYNNEQDKEQSIPYMVLDIEWVPDSVTAAWWCWGSSHHFRMRRKKLYMKQRNKEQEKKIPWGLSVLTHLHCWLTLSIVLLLGSTLPGNRFNLHTKSLKETWHYLVNFKNQTLQLTTAITIVFYFNGQSKSNKVV